MTTKKRLSILTALVLICCLILSGCGASKSAYSETGYAVSDAYESIDEEYSYSSDSNGISSGKPSSDDSTTAASVDPANAQEGLKIVYRANVSIESLNYDESIRLIQEAISSCGGYIQETSEYGGTRYYSNYVSSRSAYITARIPVDHYRDFISSTGDFGNVTSKNESSEDITSSYLDVEARLTSLTTQEARLLELLEKADSIDTILSIETQLSDVRYQIESYTSQMRTYENLVRYSTITINLEEVKETTPTSERTFGERILDAFKDSFKTFVAFLNDAVIALIYLLPFILLIVAIVLIVVFSKKAYRKKHPDALKRYEEKKALREAKKNAKKRSGKKEESVPEEANN